MDADHFARHRRIANMIACRRNLSLRHVEAILARTAAGCAEYGEENHHRPGFHPLCEAREELWDAVDLALIMPHERVEIGVAQEFADSNLRNKYSDLEYHLCAALKAIGELIERG